jgi:plasmid stabilization system protein ParE
VAVQSALDDMVAHPAKYPVIHRDTRRALLRRFPYAILYRVYGEVVVVVACMHGRRDPRRWASRT